MNRARRVGNPGWAIAILVAAALSLGGCGRKGGLELPPSAQVAAPALAEAPVVSGPAPNPVYDTSPDEPPVAASKGRRKTFILDPLLGN